MIAPLETPVAGCAPVRPATGTTPAAHALGAAGALPVAQDPGDGSGTSPVALRGEAQPAGPVHHVVGVDLSLTCTGVASRRGAVSIESTGKKDATLAQRRQRLRHLRTRIITAVGRHGDPDLIVIEGPSYGSRNAGSTHDRSGLWWLLIDVFTIRGWRVIEIAPSSRMKYATGKGMVDKDVVLAAAIKRLPIDVVNGDEADAAWLCAMGHDLLHQPLCDMPAAHRTALDIVRPRLGDPA